MTENAGGGVIELGTRGDRVKTSLNKHWPGFPDPNVSPSLCRGPNQLLPSREDFLLSDLSVTGGVPVSVNLDGHLLKPAATTNSPDLRPPPPLLECEPSGIRDPSHLTDTCKVCQPTTQVPTPTCQVPRARLPTLFLRVTTVLHL